MSTDPTAVPPAPVRIWKAFGDLAGALPEVKEDLQPAEEAMDLEERAGTAFNHANLHLYGDQSRYLQVVAYERRAAIEEWIRLATLLRAVAFLGERRGQARVICPRCREQVDMTGPLTEEYVSDPDRQCDPEVHGGNR